MKKTLIITLEFPPDIGGIATYVHDLAEALDPHKTIVLAPPVAGTSAWDDAQPYTIIRKNLLWPKMFWPRWIRLLLIARRIAKKEQVELVIIHHVLPVGYIGLYLKRFLKIPYLLFSHGTDITLGIKSKWKLTNVARVAKGAEQIIFNSESLKHRFLEVLPQYEPTTVVLYPCPDPAYLISPPESVLEALRNTYALHGKKIILTVSRFVDGKGFPHLLRMMPSILEKEPHLVWMLIGDGPKKEYILGEVQKRNLQNIVRYVGEVSHEELKQFYYLADLFVLLTHPDEGREEGLGLVFLEAAAAGLPVVAGKSGGVEEAVLHTETGLVVDLYHGDPGVIETIVTLLQNKEYSATLGIHAKARIASEFVWSHQLMRLSSWLEKGPEGKK